LGIEKIPKEERDKYIQEIEEGHYPDEEEAVLGENRGQLFVRIPVVIQRRMRWTKGDRMKFKVHSDKDNKTRLEIEVKKSASS